MKFDLSKAKYLQLLGMKEYEEIYNRMIVRELGSFSMEDFPKHFGNAVDYFVDNFAYISNLRNSELVYSESQKDLHVKEHAHMIVVALIVGNASWTYQVIFI